MKRPIGLVFAALLVICSGASYAETRVALVIGNSKYQHASTLPNAAADSAAIALLFKDAKFEVVEARFDLGSSEFRRAVRLFVEKARGADIAVAFFAGHGIEVDGINYLIPTDAKLASDIDVEDEAISLDRVLRALEPARRLRLVLLDACRDNPFAKTMRRMVATRSVGRGLAPYDPGRADTLIAFAARSGSVAEDGNNEHSPFTAALLKHLTAPGVDVRIALGRVRDEVVNATEHRQEPFVYGSLGGSTIALAPAVEANSEPVKHRDGTEAEARRDYEVAERVGTVGGWNVFLARYPTGFFADLARAHRAKLASTFEAKPPSANVAALAPAISDPSARQPAEARTLARDLQRELDRVGCSPGEISGAWGTKSRRAMQRFNELRTETSILMSRAQRHWMRSGKRGLGCVH